MLAKTSTLILLLAALLLVPEAVAQPTPVQLAAAEAGQLPIVAADQLPPFATFWLWKFCVPFPFDLWPDMTCYDLGDGSYLLDDREYLYPSVMDATGDGNDLPAIYWPEKADAPCDCGFIWLSVPGTGSNAVVLSIHNTLPGVSYTVYSSTNITLPYTNWLTETNLTGSAGDVTTGLILMAGRSNLFFRASVSLDFSAYRNYTNVLSFTALGYTNTGNDPPDTMGAIGGGGSNGGYFIELLNGNDSVPDVPMSVAVYTRTGGLAAASTGPLFFFESPSSTIDSRIIFDHHARRWVAITWAGSAVVLKVSRSEDPTDLSTNGWYKYTVSLDGGIDQPTLGLDDNGIYVTGVHSWSNTNSDHTIVAIKKPEVYSSNLITRSFDLTNDIGLAAIQPAINFDAVATNGYAWFVAKGPPELSEGYKGGPVCYRRLQWSGTNATLDTNWFFVTNSPSAYQDYFDFEITNVTAPEATSLGGGHIDLWPNSGHLAMTAIRSGFLWTCHTVGLSGTNGTYSGDKTGGSVDRSAIQWFRFNVDTSTNALTYSAHGRVYDNAQTTNVLWYYFGSIMASCAGDAVMGFSGSGATNYVSAYYTFRLPSGSMLGPRLLRAGSATLGTSRLGDYTATTIDPTDEWSFWTVQQYSDPSGASSGSLPWRTVVSRIRPGP
jgi:hypothetical protein